jgi:glycosyltransferase involved in cell wall biosynthesis
MRHVVVMVTSSYPRFPGDTVGTFMEPIARGVAARGHDVHVVAPWHPLVARPAEEAGVHFHFYRYAPRGCPHVFGYAGALKADVSFRASALAVTPLAITAGIRTAARVARTAGATVVHGHWVVPGGFMASMAAGRRLPLVISLHGSDVYVAERHELARLAARAAFSRAAWITACSADLRDRAVALGATLERSGVLPYGVDTTRFAPAGETRQATRQRLGITGDAFRTCAGSRPPAAGTGLEAGCRDAPIVFAAGRLVRKKGFEYLIDAAARLAPRWPGMRLVIAGGGDLADELKERAGDAGVAHAVRFLGAVAQSDMPAWLSAADVVAVPSVRDDSGNVDGLPNVVMEALASATPLVTTPAGGIASVVEHGRTALVVPERDVDALVSALATLLADADLRTRIGQAARREVCERYTWEQYAARLEGIYDRALDRVSEKPAPERPR